MNFLEIVKEVQASKKSIKTTPIKAVEYLGVSRRGWKVINAINQLLEKHDVISDPDFGGAYFYGQIEIKPKPKVASDKSPIDLEKNDPTQRLSLLKTADLNNISATEQGKKELITINRDAKISEAITLMLMHNFSQLPVCSTKRDTDVKIISWKSIGKALVLGHKCETVNDCKEDVLILNLDEPLFTAVKYILEKEVVLVKGKDNSICGIVTSTDIGEQFISLSEPFLIIEQIENHIRRILDDKFSIEELKAAIGPNNSEKTINYLSDLSFGQYVKIIEHPDYFSKLGLKIDRAIISKQLEEVRKIRNDVMHFSPDGITNERLEILRLTANFFQSLSTTAKK